MTCLSCISGWQLTSVIKKLNEDASVHGLIVQVRQSSESCVCAVVFQMPHCRYIYIAHLTLLNYEHLSRDVKTVYFSEPVTGLPKPVFYRLPKGLLCERDNCHQSLRACCQSIACCFKAVVARIPDARTPTPRNKGQWRI